MSSFHSRTGATAWPLSGLAALLLAAPLATDQETWLRFYGRLHPLLVHFPVGLLLAAGLLELIGTFSRSARTASPWCLCLGALGAAVAAGAGWFNAEFEPQSRSLEQTLFWHRWIGVAAAGVAFLTMAAIRVRARGEPGPYRLGLLLACALVSYGGYLGGEMVYGEGHLLEVFELEAEPSGAPADPEAPGEAGAGETEDDPALDGSLGAPPLSAAGGEAGGGAAPAGGAGPAFASEVAPILRARCVECHGPSKKKGNLRLDRREELFGEDPALWVVVPGEPEASELYRLITLPENDLDRMPGKGDALEPAQIETIRRWIAAGAQWPEGHVIELPAESGEAGAGGVREPPAGSSGDALKSGRATPAGAAVLPAASPAALEVRDAILADLRERGAHAAPLAQAETAVEVNLGLLGARAGDAELAALAGLEPFLVHLNLARTSVTDAGLERVDAFRELRRLHLENTELGDAGLAHLAHLEHLEYLNLYGTRVTDEGLQHVEALPALRRLYVWQTGVSETAAAALASARPELEVVTGADSPFPEDPAGRGDEPAGGDPAETALAPCCAAAEAEGGTCEHPCCVAAAARGEVCPTCSR